MPIEQLFYAMIPDGRVVFLKTSGVDQLSDERIRELREMRQSGDYWLEKQQMVVIQSVEETKDEDGRTWVWNHTLLAPITDYLRLTRPSEILSRYILHKDDEPPLKLEPITV